MSNSSFGKEAFESALLIFIEALETLSLPAEQQCEIGRNINVAWELKDEVAAGKYLLENSQSNLTEEQKYVIRQVIDGLMRIPDSVLVHTNTPEGNLSAMQHASWTPLRKHAEIALNSLGKNVR